MQRLLPRLNHLDGLHVAGDYVNGYGHEDAQSLGSARLGGATAYHPGLLGLTRPELGCATHRG